MLRIQHRSVRPIKRTSFYVRMTIAAALVSLFMYASFSILSGLRPGAILLLMLLALAVGFVHSHYKEWARWLTLMLSTLSRKPFSQ